MDKSVLNHPAVKDRLQKPFGQTDKINKKVQCAVMDEVIECAGGVRQLARMIDETESNISLWRYGRRNVRATAAVNISLLFKVDPSKLRPDIFPKHTKLKVGKKDE